MTVRIREAGSADLDAWAGLRHTLWPDCPLETARQEAVEILDAADQVCYVLVDDARAIGFVEGAVYAGAQGPYAHVEGWYVDPAHRGKGHGQALIGALEQWCLHRAIHRLTSDTTKDYPLSPAAHARSGFRVVHRFTVFMKDLKAGGSADADRSSA